MPNSFSLPSKVTIRKEWNLPIIKFLSESTNKKLLYLGLPSPDADDIKDWIEYIDEIVAFQCREYPKPFDPLQSKEEIKKLENKLIEYERKNIISTFSVYDGYIEEVILRGSDNSNIKYTQSDVITLYNLDYCNSLSAPIEYLDERGNSKKGYKFQSIDRLMDIQKSISSKSTKFILFLTVYCDYYEPEMGALTGEGCGSNLKEIHEKYGLITDDIEKKSRLLRSYTIQNLTTILTSKGFIPEFFPTIRYDGKPFPKSRKKFTLLHFAVLGTQAQTEAGVAPFFQNTIDLIKQKFIHILDGVKVDVISDDHEETDVSFSPENIIKDFTSYKTLWNKDE